MAIGTYYEGHPVSWIDPEYGYSILRPIEQEQNRGMYFTSNCFLNDHEMMITCVRDGAENFYRLDFITGRYVQLTDRPDIDIARAYLDKKTKTLYYTASNVVRAVNVYTFEERIIYESPGAMGTVAVNCDGTYLVASREVDYIYQSNDGDSLPMKLHRIFKVDLKTLECTPILQCNYKVDHLQCSPTEPNELIYCSHGYYCTQHRIWGTTLDGLSGGPLGPEAPNEHRTHEYFTADGRRIAYHGKFFRLDENERYQNIGHTWGIMDKDGSHDQYFSCPPGWQAGHSIISHDQTRIEADGNECISFIHCDAVSRKAEFEPVFTHRSSMSCNFVHPHPSFSDDDRFLVFATDFGGETRGNVYLIDLKSKL